jgi:hypothetical protein
LQYLTCSNVLKVQVLIYCLFREPSAVDKILYSISSAQYFKCVSQSFTCPRILGTQFIEETSRSLKFQKISRNLLHQDNKIYFFLNHQNEFKEFTQENDLVFSNDVCCDTEAVGRQNDRN